MPLIAVINTSIETIELIENTLEDEGFEVVAELIITFKRGTRDIAAFFAEHQPQVVIYDIAIPYEANWQFALENVIPRSELAPQQFIFTTTNKAVLEMLVGPTPAIELVGKPFDLEEIIQAVRNAMAQAQ
jgi:DNA-binding NtrC family response regulator